MPAADFLVGVTELVRHPANRKRVTLSGELDELVLSSSSVPPGALVVVDVELESTVDGSITATGTVRAPWIGPCRRCLRDVEGELVAEVREIFEARPVDGDTYPIDHDRIDLGPMARDAVLLSLPLAPLCDGGCAGPDPDAHPVAVHDGAPESAPADPRWAGLSELKFD